MPYDKRMGEARHQAFLWRVEGELARARDAGDIAAANTHLLMLTRVLLRPPYSYNLAMKTRAQLRALFHPGHPRVDDTHLSPESQRSYNLISDMARVSQRALLILHGLESDEPPAMASLFWTYHGCVNVEMTEGGGCDVVADALRADDVNNYHVTDGYDEQETLQHYRLGTLLFRGRFRPLPSAEAAETIVTPIPLHITAHIGRRAIDSWTRRARSSASSTSERQLSAWVQDRLTTHPPRFYLTASGTDILPESPEGVTLHTRQNPL